MKQNLKDNQSGIAHLVLIIIIVVVLGAVGFAGWRVMQHNKESNSSQTNTVTKEQAKQISEDCKKEFNDDDLCKFFSNSANTKKFSVVSTSTTEGTTTKSTMTIDGENSHLKMDGAYAMEMISIGKTTYTKAGNTWWKQTQPTSENSQVDIKADDFKYEEPKEDTPEAQKTKYEKLGKEACGDNQKCFKYKVVDPVNIDGSSYIWFDDKDYLIVRTQTLNKDGTVSSDNTFSYKNVSVSVPSPVKDLGPNQYIIPGQTEPTNLPSAQ